MLTNLELACPDDAAGLPLQSERLAHTFPDLLISLAPPGLALAPDVDRGGTLAISAGRWRNPALDLRAVDAEVAERLADSAAVRLRVDDDSGSAYACATAAIEVVTRYQRLLGGRNRHSDTRLFDGVLGALRALLPVWKPRAAADHDHALDTWRWVLRLDPDASLAVQVAALFHHVDRRASPGDRRGEADTAPFGPADAAASARRAATTLVDLGAGEALPAQVETLIAGLEQPGPGFEQQLLNDADALSFFSLEACGFLASCGLLPTRAKVAHTLARLSARAFLELASVRLSSDIAGLVDEALSGVVAPPPLLAAEGAHA